MEGIIIEKMMVPIVEYPSVDKDSTLYEAVSKLEEHRKNFINQKKDPQRAILVIDKDEHLVGLVGQTDILQALEPKYNKLLEEEHYKFPMASAFSKSFFKGALSSYSLFSKPMKDICKNAAQQKIKECMQVVRESHLINIKESFEQALNQMIVSRLNRLIVLKDGEIVGVLRRTDVYSLVAEEILQCKMS
jgi:predicted transcriptional regulator